MIKVEKVKCEHCPTEITITIKNPRRVFDLRLKWTCDNCLKINETIIESKVVGKRLR